MKRNDRLLIIVTTAALVLIACSAFIATQPAGAYITYYNDSCKMGELSIVLSQSASYEANSTAWSNGGTIALTHHITCIHTGDITKYKMPSILEWNGLNDYKYQGSSKVAWNATILSGVLDNIVVKDGSTVVGHGKLSFSKSAYTVQFEFYDFYNPYSGSRTLVLYAPDGTTILKDWSGYDQAGFPHFGSAAGVQYGSGWTAPSSSYFQFGFWDYYNPPWPAGYNPPYIEGTDYFHFLWNTKYENDYVAQAVETYGGMYNARFNVTKFIPGLGATTSAVKITDVTNGVVVYNDTSEGAVNFSTSEYLSQMYTTFTIHANYTILGQIQNVSDTFTLYAPGVTPPTVPNGTLGFSRQTYRVPEADTNITVTVERTGGYSGEISVDYTTQTYTALPGINYGSTSGTLTFADGEAAKTFQVQIIEDHQADADLVFLMVLSNPTGGANLGCSQATVTIIDSMSHNEFSFMEASYTVVAAGSITIPVKYTGSPELASVSYTTIASTATAGVDYTATSGVLYYSPGQTYATITVPILQTSSYDKMFYVMLFDPHNGALDPIFYQCSVTIAAPEAPVDGGGGGTGTPSQVNAVFIAASNSSLFGWTYGVNTYSGVTLKVYNYTTLVDTKITANDGSAPFNLLDIGTRYTVNATGGGIVSTNQTVTIVTGQTTYYIWVWTSTIPNPNPSASPIPTGTTYTGDVTRDINAKIGGTMINATAANITGIYTDYTGGTTSLTYNLYYMNKSNQSYDLIQTWSGSGPNQTRSFVVLNAAGNGYRLNITGWNNYYGNISRRGDYYAPANTTWDLGWPEDLKMGTSLGALLVIVALTCRRHLIAGLWLTDVVGWFFFGIGFMGAAGAWAPTGLGICLAFLVINALGEYRSRHNL